MARPEVSVVVPFAGDAAAAREVVAMLEGLATRPGDELILVDNADVAVDALSVRVVRALGEASAAHARNAGAAVARRDWILFLDADVRPPADLLDSYFDRLVAHEVGALVGEIRAAAGATALAARYAAQKNFLDARAHLAHPFRPRAAAANLLVRRAAFEATGGFHEGLRAAEDTDFCWRLQELGWTLELREHAAVEHRYRETVGDLRRQWRAYAAGRAWLARRYPGFRPEPAVRRVGKRLLDRRRARAPVAPAPPPPAPAPPPPATAPPPPATAPPPPAAAPPPPAAAPPPLSRLQRAELVALDVLLAAEELAGFALSNRPARTAPPPRPATVVRVAGTFPQPGDPSAPLPLEAVRVEAATRPESPALGPGGALRIDYREDDGAGERLVATLALVARHPRRCLADIAARRGTAASSEPSLAALAPAARRLGRDPGAVVRALGGEDDARLASRLAALAGSALDHPPATPDHPPATPDHAPATLESPREALRVHIVDASAFTPPYDHALCSALARAGAHVELVTSRFGYGEVPDPDGYAVRELFYRHARGALGSSARRATKLAEHVPDMLRYRRLAARAADVVHFQWLDVQWLDARLLPRRPVVLTAHDLLPREPRHGQAAAQRRLYDAVDAVVVHSEYGRRQLVDALALDAAKVHVIPHGAFDHLAALEHEHHLPAELGAVEVPVVLFFGLLRPYKGIETLLRAWHGIEGAELWIVGRPRMPLDPLRAIAPPNVRFVARFVPDLELPAYFRRADLVVLPYTRTERFDQSGVLAAALAFGKPTVVSDIGGFTEIAATGAAELVPPDDPAALHAALAELIADRDRRERLGAAAAAAGRGPYSWAEAARKTLALYRELAR